MQFVYFVLRTILFSLVFWSEVFWILIVIEVTAIVVISHLVIVRITGTTLLTYLREAR